MAVHEGYVVAAEISVQRHSVALHTLYVALISDLSGLRDIKKGFEHHGLQIGFACF